MNELLKVFGSILLIFGVIVGITISVYYLIEGFSNENVVEGYNYLPRGSGHNRVYGRRRRPRGGYWSGLRRRPWMPWYWRTYYYPSTWRYVAYPSTGYSNPGLQTYYL